jgi:hypothetical protein
MSIHKRKQFHIFHKANIQKENNSTLSTMPIYKKKTIPYFPKHLD